MSMLLYEFEFSMHVSILYQIHINKDVVAMMCLLELCINP